MAIGHLERESMLIIETHCPDSGTVRQAAFSLCPDCCGVGLHALRFPPTGDAGTWVVSNAQPVTASFSIRWDGIRVETACGCAT